MTQGILLTPVRVETGTADEDGRLVFAGDFLVAVLVRLAEGHDNMGHWFLEHGFGRLGVSVAPTFPDLQGAETWISGRLSGMADRGAVASDRYPSSLT